MYLSKTEYIVINLVLLAYSYVGLFTEYGQDNGGWIIGGMIALCYIVGAVVFIAVNFENLLKKWI